MLESVNPATEEVIGEYRKMSTEEVDERLSAATLAFGSWRTTSFFERAELMNRAAGVLRERKEEWARLMTTEMGKPIAQARAEVEKCAWACDYFAEHAEAFLEREVIETDATRSYVRFDPLGPIYAIMPWNFPFWQVMRFAAPNLMAGNVGILNHSSNVTGCALALEELFREAGFPDGTFQTLVIDHDLSEGVMRDRRVRGVTLTGSVRAGRVIGRVSGDEIKPSVLELGGSDPFIVLADCDLDATLDGAITGRTQNNGQSCIAAKRFIVEEAIAREFTNRFVERMAALDMGDPLDESTEIGPMARADLRLELHEQVERTTGEGAECRTGGSIPAGKGFFYPPTVLTGVAPGMAAFDEETFGPAAAVIVARDVDHAIELANDSTFGLGASLWTRRDDVDELVARIESGHVAVNGIVKSDPRLPFGGIKDSGYGRELSRFGILEFVNRKTVWIR